MSSNTSFTQRLTAREAWIGPASGFVCSVLVTLIGRRAGFEYRRETASAVFFVVSVFVTGYFNGQLRARPAWIVALAIVSAFAGAAIVHY